MNDDGTKLFCAISLRSFSLTPSIQDVVITFFDEKDFSTFGIMTCGLCLNNLAISAHFLLLSRN